MEERPPPPVAEKVLPRLHRAQKLPLRVSCLGTISYAEATDADCAVFAGDDLTDEHALSALGAEDLGVKVGRAESIARVRVTGPEAMSHMLARLAHLRRKHTRALQQVEEATSRD